MDVDLYIAGPRIQDRAYTEDCAHTHTHLAILVAQPRAWLVLEPLVLGCVEVCGLPPQTSGEDTLYSRHAPEPGAGLE